jgi:hypothetical protein
VLAVALLVAWQAGMRSGGAQGKVA